MGLDAQKQKKTQHTKLPRPVTILPKDIQNKTRSSEIVRHTEIQNNKLF